MKNLKKIIQKANPKIMELKFGCEIEYVDSNTLGRKKRIARYVDGPLNVLIFDSNGRVIITKRLGQDSESIKSLGRPITLADCTSAIIESKRWWGLALKEQVKDFFNLNMYWKLKDDNLDNQSKQTINFLKKILIK